MPWMTSYNAAKFARAGEGDAVVIEGFAQLQAALGRVADGVDTELKSKVRAVGERVALVAAGNAPRRTGELQHSEKVSVTGRSASVYNTAPYGGALNVGAWVGGRRGVHISRGRASHYQDRAVRQLAPWVRQEMDSVVDWLMTMFQEG